MSPARASRVLRFAEGRDYSLARLGLGGVSAVGAALYLVALRGAADGFDPVLWVLVPLAGLLLPVADSGFPLGYWGFLLALWVWHTEPGSFSAWAVLGAAGLVLSHAALALATTAPTAAGVPRAVLRRWAARVALACVPAVLLAVGAGAVGAVAGTAATLVTVTALLAVALGTAWLRSTPPSED